MTSQPNDTCGEQLDDWAIAHSASVLSDEAATLLNRATGGLSSPDLSSAHPSVADKAEWTMDEDLDLDNLPITVELRLQTPVASDPHIGADGTPGMLIGKRSRTRSKNRCVSSKRKIGITASAYAVSTGS